MAVNIPKYAKGGTSKLMRHITRLHQQLTFYLGKQSDRTLRRTAWQIEVYLEEHGKYLDAEFIRTIQGSIEKVVQRKLKNKWTVARSARSLIGRTPRKPKNRGMPIPSEISQKINEQLLRRQDQCRRFNQERAERRRIENSRS